MSSNIENFEWHIGEEGWSERPSSAVVAYGFNQALLSSGEMRIIFSILRALILAALALVISQGAFLSQQEHDHEQQRTAIAPTLSIEEEAWRLNNREIFATTIDPEIAEVWSPQWRKYWRGSTSERTHFFLDVIHIEAHAIEDESGNAEPYLFVNFLDSQPARDWWLISPTRETRVYTKADSTWIRTIPPEGYWGTYQRISSENVKYEFYERDRSLVESIAPSIEAHHRNLFAILQIEPLSEQRKFTVRISPHPRNGRGSRSTVLYLTSPLLATKPAHFSDRAYIERKVIEQITAFAVNNVGNWRGSADNLHWSTIMWALRSQLEERLLGTPSPWFQQSEPIFVDYGQERYPISLEELTRIRKPKVAHDRRHIFWQQVGAELVVKYALERYGEERAPDLIRAFNKNRSWEQLVLTVYGVSLDEFEDGFNVYLGQRYGWN